jgi:FAD/FMN-containing dehydrogenase
VTVRLAAGAGPVGAAGAGTDGEAGGELAADRLLAVAGGLAVVPAPAALGRFWNERTAGLARFERRPVVVIDPARPPRALLSQVAASEVGVSDVEVAQTVEDGDGRDDDGV